jgi:hypothetical protein
MNNFRYKPPHNFGESLVSHSLGYKNLNILIKLNQFLIPYFRGVTRG